MGNQQILLLVLSVIIVGVLIALGISLFLTYSYTTNRNAMTSEMTTYIPYLEKYCTTSKMLGGAGDKTGLIDGTLVTIARVASYIGFNGPNYSTTGENGEFRLISVRARDFVSFTYITVVMQGLGKHIRAGKHPMITASIVIVQIKSTKRITENHTVTASDAVGW